MSTGLVYDPAYLQHDTGYGHPEKPKRLKYIMEHLASVRLLEKTLRIDPEPCDLKWIENAHTSEHIRKVQQACASAPAYLDSDTPVSKQSYDIALLAAGGVLRACEAVADGKVRNAFCAVRPPGHHAETERAMGFCLFNNVAVAAKYLQGAKGIGRILILDWDVHHGNGTQHIFYEDPNVFYCSIHQFPLYPGTGTASERGRGEGEGSTLNIPLSAGCGDAEYRLAFEAQIIPSIQSFSPEFILVSAGFDAHRADPLANMNVTDEGFAMMTEMTKNIADEICEGKLVSVLEGGYDLAALSHSVGRHVGVLLAAE